MLELILVMREITGRPQQVPAPPPEVVIEQVSPLESGDSWDPDRRGIRYFPLPE